MSHRLAVGLTALGLFALLIAFAIPPAINASQSTVTDTFAVDEGETVTVTDGLTVTLNDSTNSQATVEFEDTDTGIDHRESLNESDNATFTINGEDVAVTLTESTNTDAQLKVEYSPRYAWDDGAKALAAQMDVILLLFAFILLVGGMGAVVS